MHFPDWVLTAYVGRLVALIPADEITAFSPQLLYPTITYRYIYMYLYIYIVYQKVYLCESMVSISRQENKDFIYRRELCSIQH